MWIWRPTRTTRSGTARSAADYCRTGQAGELSTERPAVASLGSIATRPSYSFSTTSPHALRPGIVEPVADGQYEVVGERICERSYEAAARRADDSLALAG